MRKIEVLQLMTDSNIGGAERVALWLAQGLDRQRFNSSICCLASRGPIFEEAEREGVKIYSLGMKSKWDFLKAFKLIRILRKNNIRILNSHLFHANLLARIMGRCAGVPIIISTEHIMGIESGWRIFLNKITSIFADKVIAVSFSVGDFLAKTVGIKPSKIEVIQNGIEHEKFQVADSVKEDKKREFGIKKDELIIGTVARIHKQKGHLYLLQAAKKVIAEIPNSKFFIIGDGPLMGKMKDLTDKLGISKNIVFTGFYSNIPAIMSVLDIFVLPSLWEGLPITILEAMAMKKPVIASRVCGNIEAVEDGETGILVPPRDVNALSEAIIRLLKDDHLRERMGNAGFERVKGLFAKKRMLEETACLYEKLLEGCDLEK